MLAELVKGKRVLFITTKNIDYIRNAQEIRILKENAANVELVYSSKKSYFFRIVEIYSLLFIAEIKKICRKGIIYRNDIIFIGFAPQLIIPMFDRFFSNKTIIIDFFISVYDTLICDRKIIPDGSILANICHRLDEKAIEKADYIIADTKAHGRFFVEEFQADKNKLEIVYLEADKSIYFPRPPKKSVEQKGKFIVLYFGSILPLQGINVVLEAIRLLKNYQNISFEIIGPISKKYNKPIQENVRYIDWISQEDLAQHIANADLCLAGHFDRNIKKADRTIPGKAYIYEAMDKAMILGDTTANRELFIEDNTHRFVELGKAEKLAEAILSFT